MADPGMKDDKKNIEESRYGEELLSANWNPVIDLLESSAKRTEALARGAEPGLREEDADAFLGRIYTQGL
jgi:hypothetical protein